MTKQEFIAEIAKTAQKYAPQFGINVVSPCIAQACLESAYGTSNKAKYHNYFGLKYRANRCPSASGTFVDGSSEQNKDGSYVKITDQWFKFDSLDAGVKGYFEFINISNYANLKGVTDPQKYLENIKADGYATSLSYVDNVYKVITANNLTQYDKVANATNTTATNTETAITIIPNTGFQGYNVSARTVAPAYIAMHYVGASGTAKNNVTYFNGGNRQASADYFVDESNICAYNPDPLKYYCWSVGDGSSGTYGGKCSNRNSISIEMCCYQDASGWHFKDATVKNAIALTKYLMKKYNIPASNVIRHYDVSRKACPGVDGWIPTIGSRNETNWNSFKKQIGDTSVVVTSTTTKATSSAVSAGNAYTTVRKGSTGNAVKELQQKLNKVGYNLVVDGDFGSNTYAAVIDFQKKNSLVQDGIVGEKT